MRPAFKSKIGQAIIGSLGLRFLGLGLTFLGSAVLARALGAAGLGEYAIAFSLISLMGLPVQMGLPVLVMRVTARAEATGDWPRMRGMWTWATRRIGISFGVLLLGSAALYLIARPRFETSTLNTVLMGLPLVPLIALAGVRSAALRGLQRPLLAQMPEVLIRPALLTGGIALASWGFGARLSATSAMGMHVLAAAVAFAIGAAMLWLARPPALLATAGREEHGAEWKAAIWPLAMLSSMQVISQNTDLLMLGFWRADAEVGVYKIALSAASLAILGLNVVNLVLVPKFAQLHAKGENQALAKLAATTSGASLACTLPVVLLLAVWGKELLGWVYGEAFQDGFLPLMILLGGQSISAFFGASISLLNMSGHEKASLRGLIASTALNVALNAALIPSFGNVGAAVATAFSVVAWNVLLWQQVRLHLGFDCSAVGLLKHLK